MGMRPNATALSEMCLHLGGRYVQLSKTNALADGIEMYVSRVIST